MNADLERLVNGLLFWVDNSTRAGVFAEITCKNKGVWSFRLVLQNFFAPVDTNNVAGHYLSLVEIFPSGNVK